MVSETIRVRVRFSEVDPIRMVWHGNYVKYMEDAREAFGRHWGLSYRLIFDSGYYAPVYDMHLRYFATSTVDDELDHHRFMVAQAWSENMFQLRNNKSQRWRAGSEGGDNTALHHTFRRVGNI